MGLRYVGKNKEPHLMSVDRTMGAVSNSTMTEKNRGTRFGNARRVSAFASA